MSMAFRADAHARPGNDSLVDGVAHRRAGRPSAFSAHITLGSEAGHQVGFCGLLSKNRSPWDRLLDGLQILRTGMEKQMHVRIDQARQQRCIAEVDHLRALWMLYRNADSLDPLTLDKNLARPNNVSGVDFEQSCRVQHDGRSSQIAGLARRKLH